jgi:serine/threonine-protein kinase
MNLEEYHRLTKSQIKEALIQNTIEKERDIKVSGLPAKEIVYTIPQDPSKQRYFNLKLKQVYLIKNNTAYLITYTALTPEFNDYLKSADIVFNTFNVLK